MEKDMITVIDDVFTKTQLEHFREKINYSIKNEPVYKKGEGWHSVYSKHDNEFMCSQLLAKVGKYFNLQNIQGYDYWTHTNTKPVEWHYDKDEIAYLEGKDRYPVCSSVFYLEVCGLVNGKLQFKNGVEVKPIENRLVIFSPRLYHGVEKFEGVRTSININPWNTKVYK
tara:strand:- start:1343 stop:1849 length:507 start_codon:yes stop_codon:yes gene_type:complete